MKRPPYARLLSVRRNHTHNNWWVLIGSDAWATAAAWTRDCNRHRPFTLCPAGKNPTAFDWSVYRDAPAPVGLIRCGEVEGDQLRRLVQALLEAGSPRVLDFSGSVAVYVGVMA